MTMPSTRTREAPFPLLSLEEWREEFTWHPFHFWQLADNNHVQIESACSTLVREFAHYSSDRSGRQEIRQAIARAEDKLRTYLGYSIAPHYVIDTLPFPHNDDPRLTFNGYTGTDGHWKTLQLSEGRLQAIGVETLTAIGASAVVYSDQDGDSLNETFTLTIATTVTDPEEIAVYFAAADRLDGQDAGDRWRITPLRVTIADGTATLRGRAWQLVRPIKYQGFMADPESQLSPTDAGNFATTLEVYRRYTSAGTTFDTAQAVLVWETASYPGWATPCTGSDPAGEAYALARAGIHNADIGRVTIGPDLSWGDGCRPPDRVIVRYLAGQALEYGRIAQSWRDTVARLSAAELTRPICACQDANRDIYEWQFDLSRAKGNLDEQYNVSDDVMSNPFGPRRGQVYAWRKVQHLGIERGYAP